jgi:hypothetical protein
MPTAVSTRRAPVQKAARTAGWAFLLIGALGFIPGATTHLGQLSLAGHDSQAALLGLFDVSVLHNAVHLAFGGAGLVMAVSVARSRTFFVGGGLIYLALSLYGSVIDQASPMNVVPVNSADNWLHLGLAAVMIALGAVLGRRRSETRARPITPDGSTP